MLLKNNKAKTPNFYILKKKCVNGGKAMDKIVGNSVPIFKQYIKYSFSNSIKH